MWASNDTRWLIPFSLFCGGIVASLVYLHASDAEEVPQTASWSIDKPLAVCEAPDWVYDNLDAALALVAPWVTYSSIEVVGGECPEMVTPLCVYELEEGAPRTVACVELGVLLTMSDQAFTSGHGDETLLESQEGGITKATVLFPGELENRSGDVEILVIAHALLHAEGYLHVINNLPKPFSAEPTGHLMADSTSKLGTGTDGLP